MKKKIQPTELTENAIRLISQDWMLITAGSPQKFNTMTASWGGLGYLWNRPVAYVFIRPERYTFEFMESNEHFTLSFFGADYHSALSLLGSKSGRDGDKVAEAGLTPYFTELHTPAFEQARIVLECRKLYGTMLAESDFTDKDMCQKWYQSNGSLHKMFVAEILNVWVEQHI